MSRLFILCLVIFFSSLSFAIESFPNSSTCGGISGFTNLTTTELLPINVIRIQGGFAYSWTEGETANTLLIPVSGSWGISDKLNAGIEVPFYLTDDSDGGSALGNISLSCSYLYETARGGTDIVFLGKLDLPSGETGRDAGSQISAGMATSTIFRLFRLHAAAYYGFSGGDNPFEDDIYDVMNFEVGGSSYLSSDWQAVGGIDGSTDGDIHLTGTVVYYGLSDLAVFGSASAGYESVVDIDIALGVAWTPSAR